MEWIWKHPNDEFMSFKEFVQEYVCKHCKYSNKEVQQWLRKYNLSMESRVIFVRTGHFKDAVRITDGYLLPGSGFTQEDKILSLFVSNKR